MEVIFRAREEIVVVDKEVDVAVDAVVIVVVEVAVEAVAWVVEDTAVVELAFPFGSDGMHPLNSKSEVISEARNIDTNL
ncbi:MAG: hypothetical protein B6U72_00100 [Candidatus Altiarchaeales archaeon ex4484_2]|nr:MAG: hypothetical protein B6U72_00100 [Candidatus Altiarchaeales archaeon ex4484_2]